MYCKVQNTYPEFQLLLLSVVSPKCGGRGRWWRHLLAPAAAPPSCKNPPKIGFTKNSWNWLIIVMPATFWQILNITQMQWPETEMLSISKNGEITSCELILGGFRPFQKLDSQKLVKLTIDCYACNSLTNFEHHSNAMTRDGNVVNFKKWWNHIMRNYFWPF